MRQIKVFRACQPDEVPTAVYRANEFLAGFGRSPINVHVTETGSSAGYSYTITIEYLVEEEK